MSDCQQLVETGWNKTSKLCLWNGLYNFWGMLNPCNKSNLNNNIPNLSNPRCSSGSHLSLSQWERGTVRSCCWTGHKVLQKSNQLQQGQLQHDANIFLVQNNCRLLCYPHSNLQWGSIFSLSVLREFVNSDLGHSFLQSMEPTSTADKHFAGNWDHKGST